MAKTLSIEQRLLRRYLDRYRNLTIKCKSLEKMKETLTKDFVGLHAISMNGASKPSMAHSPVPTYVLKNDELLCRIAKKKKEASEALQEIESLIGLLNEDSFEYMALSLRYIARMSAEDIAEMIPCGRRTVFRLIDRACSDLLNIDKVMVILEKFSQKIGNF